MRLSRRRVRTIYRVYGEEEYLAGADPFPDWDASPHGEATRGGLGEEPPHRRRGESTHRRHGLRRLAGAAALTGAVGAVGGAIGLAARDGHAVHRRELAQGRAPAVRAASMHAATMRVAATRRAMSDGSASPRRVGMRRSLARAGSHDVNESRHAAKHGVPRPSRRVEVSAGTAAASAFPVASTAVNATDDEAHPDSSVAMASTARSAPIASYHRSSAQSEFGFER
jgi:hypothetical protein